MDNLVVEAEVAPVVRGAVWLQEPRCHGDKRSADKTGKCVESTRLDGPTRWLYPAVHVSKVSADTGSVETGRHTVDTALLDSHFIWSISTKHILFIDNYSKFYLQPYFALANTV